MGLVGTTFERRLQAYLGRVEKEIVEREQKIEREREVLSDLRRERRNIVKRLEEPHTGEWRNGSDSLVVMTEALRPIVEKAIEDRGGLHVGRPNKERVNGGQKRVAEEAKVSRRRLYGIRKKETRHTVLPVADQILTGLGLQSMLGNEVPVYKQVRKRKSDGGYKITYKRIQF